MNNTDLVLSSLQQAFSLAEPEGYCRTFIDHGPPMQQLLQQAHTRGIAPDYVAQLLAVFPAGEQGSSLSPPHPSTSAPPPLVEPLKERELSILRFMAAGLSNREIAEELYLSPNTVKWYGSQIYGKLGVKKRAEAVDRAHELGIL
jgi:LuxR family maltose regulon positive regulatory protein